MEKLIIKFKLFTVPLIVLTLLTTILGIVVWYFIFNVLKIEYPEEWIDPILFCMPLLTGIVVYFTFRNKWEILENWFSSSEYEPKYSVYISAIITTAFLFAGLVGFLKQDVQVQVLDTLNCINEIQELGKSQNCQLKSFYIDKSNFGIDKLNTTYTQNNSFSSENFVTTIVCPIYCDSLESEKSASVAHWFVIRHFERFNEALPILQKDSIFKAKTMQYITELIEDTIKFEYVEYFPYIKSVVDKDLDRCLLAASISDKFNESKIKGFVFPRDLKFSDQNKTDHRGMFRLMGVLWCVTILLPLVFKVNLNEYDTYKNK